MHFTQPQPMRARLAADSCSDDNGVKMLDHGDSPVMLWASTPVWYAMAGQPSHRRSERLYHVASKPNLARMRISQLTAAIPFTFTPEARGHITESPLHRTALSHPQITYITWAWVNGRNH
jgi:hypothetical protein